MRKRVIVTGAAGLVGQNLITKLGARDDLNIVAIDKHPANVAILRRLHPGLEVIEADLSEPGAWEGAFAGGGILVQNHAQIGALKEAPFIANNVTATERVLAAAKAGGVGYIVHISSSVVNSRAVDYYTESKKAQERLVLDCGIQSCVLRPTLMFGWFDRKHLGWLARFMKRTPVFPVPGSGKFARQPLYAGDFCSVIVSAVDRPQPGTIHDVSGLEKIDYLDLIRAVKEASRAKAKIVRIPYSAFHALLATYALFDRNPPFTTRQLEALVIPEEFPGTTWPADFGVVPTPLARALEATFRDPVYSDVVLEF